MPEPSAQGHGAQRQFGDSAKRIRVGDWSDLIEKNLLIEFVGDFKAFMRIKKIRKDILRGVQLKISPRDMRLEEHNSDMVVHKRFIKRISAIDVQVRECPITFPDARTF